MGATLFVIPERTLFGTVGMRLSDDATGLVGTFVTKNEKFALSLSGCVSNSLLSGQLLFGPMLS